MYYCTFTCFQWLPLFEITNFYDFIYSWFDRLKKEGNTITGYVIMPNHIHFILFVHENSSEINHILKEGKRFMAYEIIKRLKNLNRNDLLIQLQAGINTKEKREGKKHRVFEELSDIKHCSNDKFTEQKLTYMHNNPVKGKWRLAENNIDYLHSSAKYYLTGEHGIYNVINYRELDKWVETVTGTVL